jgi:hypothetical protein
MPIIGNVDLQKLKNTVEPVILQVDQKLKQENINVEEALQKVEQKVG